MFLEEIPATECDVIIYTKSFSVIRLGVVQTSADRYNLPVFTAGYKVARLLCLANYYSRRFFDPAVMFPGYIVAAVKS